MSILSDAIEKGIDEAKGFAEAAEASGEHRVKVGFCISAIQELAIVKSQSKRLKPSLVKRGVQAMIEVEEQRVAWILLKAISGD